ncbi:ThiF family adenylyltransferase [Streptomyces sp. NPDC026659]|uniref:HesA/MoeB/ThiF family protein n=1 Tax=Streptomyces sp. NPDC026659 TaxID=3155123 RepID=UPI0033E1016F
MATPTDEGRFARHGLIPGWNQDRLSAATVVVVGAGALGNAVVQALALAGVGRLLVCDPDVVAVSNLSRCPLFLPSDVGRPKAETVARTLGRLAPDTETSARVAPLVSGVGLAELRDADLVVSCLDSRAARVELATRCNLASATMLDGGTHEWGGQVSVHPPGGRCWGCGHDQSSLFVQDSPYSCAAPVRTLPEGASAPVSLLVGAWLANYAVRLLLGLPVGSRLLRVDAAGGAVPVAGRTLAEHPDPGCPLHERIEDADVTRLPLSARDTVGDLLLRVDADEEPLTWTGFREAGTGRSPLATGTRLRAASPDTRLARLGVAPREILTVMHPRKSGLRYVELTGETAAAAEVSR